jgi:ribosomal protein L37AE/L43A
MRFRCKTRNKDLYLFLKCHHDKFMEESKLRQLWHQYDTNNVEAFNKFLTKFLPKDKTYCQTIENKARSLLAVGLQSVGYRQFYGRIFLLTGIPLTTDDITSLFFRKEDCAKLWRKQSRRKESYKITRMRTQYKKLREGVEKLRSDNRKDLGYSSGMMGPGEAAVEVQQKGRARKQRGQKNPCPHCASTTHSRRSSSLCPANKLYAKSATTTNSTEVAVGARNISYMCDMRIAYVT